MTKKEKEEKEKELLRQKERQLRKEGKLPPLSASAPVAPTKSKDKDKTAVCKPSNGKEPVKAASSSNSKSIPKAAPCQNGLAAKAAQRNPPMRAEKDLNSSSKSLVTKQPSLSSKSNQPPAKPVASKSQSANRPSTPSGPQRASAAMGSKQMPPNKGKTLAPVGAGSRPFPPYRDMYPPMHRPPAKRKFTRFVTRRAWIKFLLNICGRRVRKWRGRIRLWNGRLHWRRPSTWYLWSLERHQVNFWIKVKMTVMFRVNCDFQRRFALQISTTSWKWGRRRRLHGIKLRTDDERGSP